nr:hypothetical protein [uncultured Blautia sp.]
MYTREDLKKSLAEVKEKIETTEITEEVFLEIEKTLKQIGEKRSEVQQQIFDLVKQANDMCLLDKQIQGSVNDVYTKLKAKKLMDEGIDLQNESNRYKYSHGISTWLIFGDGLKVELNKMA